MVACTLPQLIAACHVLLRLHAPRHPPCALSSLTGISKVHSLCITQRLVFDCQRAIAAPARRAITPASAEADAKHDARSIEAVHAKVERPSLESGGDSGARTRSLRLAKPALSQLSYIPAANRRGRPPRGPGALVGLGGLEPPTSRLSGVRSNQLSYRPTPRNGREESEPLVSGARS